MISEVFPWNENFETGIHAIDKQHQELVRIINQLAAHLTDGSDEAVLKYILDELVDYTVYHFTTEEKIWHKYLPLDALTLRHQQEHQDFIDELSSLQHLLSSQPSEKAYEQTLSFLTHWLAFHILDHDRRMAKIVLFLKQGSRLEEAKLAADKAMNGAMMALIDTILSMYDFLTTQTLELMREVTRRQQVEQKLTLSKNVIDSTFESIFITDIDGKIIDINPSFSAYIGSDASQLIGRNIHQVKPDMFTRDKLNSIWQITSRDGHWSGEINTVNARGNNESAWLTLSAIHDEHAHITNYVGVLSSASQLLQHQHLLEQQANHDALTGLPSRRLLHDRLEIAIQQSKRYDKMLAVCFLDLDGFKAVNDTLGHEAGDELLRVISGRLENLLRGEDTVARIGGDEFILLFSNLTSETMLAPLMNKVLTCIQEPVIIQDKKAYVSGSIGVSLFPKDSDEPKILLKHADQAMYQAKQSGKAMYCMWHTEEML